MLKSELPVLLVAERLDRRGVDDALLVVEGQGDGVLRHHGLTGGGVGGDKDRLVVLYTQDGLGLERVQHEGVGLGGLPPRVKEPGEGAGGRDGHLVGAGGGRVQRVNVDPGGGLHQP